ncbi:Protein of unknown function, partial [Gryllus bimaculatus]
MQEAMWTMEQKMQGTEDTVRAIASSLKAEGQIVQKLEERMEVVERRLDSCTERETASYCTSSASASGGGGGGVGGGGGGVGGGSAPASASSATSSSSSSS